MLAPLSDFAAEHDAAVVGITHLNKAHGTDAMSRITGSNAFPAAARSAWLVERDPDDEDRRLFLPVKNNLGTDREGLSFKVEGCEIPSKAGPVKTSRVVWGSEPVTISADEAVAEPERRSALEDAKEFLLDALKDGPKERNEIKGAGEREDHSWGTIRRAQKALKIVASKAEYGRWEWNLPSQSDTQVAQHAQHAQTNT